MNSELAINLRQRVLREFLDLILMCKLRNRTMSGYMARSYIHKNYDYLVSLGTVYSVLYSLERRKLIKGNMKTKKRMFELTTKGEEMIESILVADKGLLGLVKNLINAV